MNYISLLSFRYVLAKASLQYGPIFEHGINDKLNELILNAWKRYEYKIMSINVEKVVFNDDHINQYLNDTNVEQVQHMIYQNVNSITTLLNFRHLIVRSNIYQYDSIHTSNFYINHQPIWNKIVVDNDQNIQQTLDIDTILTITYDIFQHITSKYSSFPSFYNDVHILYPFNAYLYFYFLNQYKSMDIASNKLIEYIKSIQYYQNLTTIHVYKRQFMKLCYDLCHTTSINLIMIIRFFYMNQEQDGYNTETCFNLLKSIWSTSNHQFFVGLKIKYEIIKIYIKLYNYNINLKIKDKIMVKSY